MKLILRLFTSLLIISSFGLFSCTKNDSIKTSGEITIKDKDFQKSVVLDAEPIDQINRHLLYPQFIHITDSMFIAVESSMKDEIFKVFSLKDFTHLRSFGKRGSGPGEFSKIISNTVQVKDSSKENTIGVYNWVEKVISNLNMITDQTTNDLAPKTNQYVLPPELMLAQRVAFLNDSTIAAMGGIEDGAIAFASTTTDAVTYAAHTSKMDKYELSSRDMRDLNMGEFAVDKRKDRIVLAMQRFPKIIILDLEGNIKHVTRFPLQEHPAEISQKQRTIFYKDVKVTKNYIYAAYIGLNSQEMGKIYDNYISGDFSFSTEIHVFNWDGQPVRKLILRDKFVPFIQLHSSSNRLFAIDQFSDSLSILRFKSEFIQ